MKKITIIALSSIAAFAFCGKKEHLPFVHQAFAGWKAAKTIEIKKAAETTAVTIISNKKKPSSGGFTDGAFLVIPEKVAEGFAGETVQVTFTAKSGDKKGSEIIWAAYSTAEVGNSGWKKFALTKDFKQYSFMYDVKKGKKGGVDYIGFNSDMTGSGKTAVIDKVEIRAVKKEK